MHLHPSLPRRWAALAPGPEASAFQTIRSQHILPLPLLNRNQISDGSGGNIAAAVSVMPLERLTVNAFPPEFIGSANVAEVEDHELALPK